MKGGWRDRGLAEERRDLGAAKRPVRRSMVRRCERIGRDMGLVALVLFWAVVPGPGRLERLRRTARPIDQRSWNDLLSRVAETLDLRRDRLPPIATLPAFGEPITAGVLHPIVLILRHCSEHSRTTAPRRPGPRMCPRDSPGSAGGAVAAAGRAIILAAPAGPLDEPLAFAGTRGGLR